MQLLLITDLHGRRDVLQQILTAAKAADAVLFGGDITEFGSPRLAEEIIRQAQAVVQTVFAVAGNCDSAAIDRRLAELGVGLHGRAAVCQSVRLQGLSGMPPWIPTMYHFTEEELQAALQTGLAGLKGSGPHVVLSHAPPYGLQLDRTWLGQHAGSTALREFIEAKQPNLVVCGHIHEGRGIEQLGETTVVNCGPAARGSYAVAEVGEAVHVELRYV